MSPAACIAIAVLVSLIIAAVAYGLTGAPKTAYDVLYKAFMREVAGERDIMLLPPEVYRLPDGHWRVKPYMEPWRTVTAAEVRELAKRLGSKVVR
jgi:hypothetical protein